MRSKLFLIDYPSLATVTVSLGFNARWACFGPAGQPLCVGDGGKACLVGPGLSWLSTGLTQNLRGAAYSSAGQLLVVGNRGLAALGPHFEVLDTGVEANLRRVAWAPDSSKALVVGNAGTAMLFEPETKRFVRLWGAHNNLRGVSWVAGEDPVIVGSAYADMFVPSPNIYRVRGGSLEAVAEEPKVDLLAVCWWAAKRRFAAVGYDVVLHEPRIYLVGEDVEPYEWGVEEAVYLSAVCFHPREDVGLIATSHPSSRVEERRSYAYLLDGGRPARLLELSGYGFVCAAWSADGSRALLLASEAAKTYNV